MCSKFVEIKILIQRYPTGPDALLVTVSRRIVTSEHENKMNEVLTTVAGYLQPTTRDAVSKNININKSFRQSTKVASISSFLGEIGWRLPKTSTPISYDLHLISNIHTGALAVSGDVSIKLKVLETTDRLTLHSKNIAIEDLKLFDAADNELTILGHSLYEPTEILIIHLTDQAAPNTELTLKVQYRFTMYNPPTDDMVGFYRTSYLTSVGTRRFDYPNRLVSLAN